MGGKWSNHYPTLHPAPPAITLPSSNSFIRCVSSSFVFSSTMYSSSCDPPDVYDLFFSYAECGTHNPTRFTRKSSRVSCAFFVDSDSFSFLSAVQALLLSSNAACTASSCAFPW